MSPWELPTALEAGGARYAIRTDFRVALYLLDVLADPDYEPDEKGAICLRVLFTDWQDIPRERWGDALEQAAVYLDGGRAIPDGKRRPRTVDWAQDAPIILPAVNKVLGREVRAMEHLHWWTFLGAYMEIGESLFSAVVGIRQKRARGKRLEKYEQEFLKENRALVELRPRPAQADETRRAALRELFV